MTVPADNQPPEFAPRDLWADDVGLREAVAREGGGDFADRIGTYARHDNPATPCSIAACISAW